MNPLRSRIAENLVHLPAYHSQMSYIKISANGSQLPNDATEWVANIDPRTDLMWPLSIIEVPNWQQQTIEETEEKVRALTIGGFTDWFIPTVYYLLTLVEPELRKPSIDTEFFPGCPSGRFWTSTQSIRAGVHGSLVNFKNGDSEWADRRRSGYVRAVRRVMESRT